MKPLAVLCLLLISVLVPGLTLGGTEVHFGLGFTSPVGDLAESLRRVREEGGEVIKVSRGSDGEDAIAVVKDPVGASLALARG